MRKNNGAGKNKHQTDAIDEVEELLKLTQDDLLLKLNVNSHLKSKSRSDFIPESSNTNSIHPDLDLRFQALRLKKPSNPNPKSEINGDHHEDIDNLFARYAALKGPSSDPTITTPNSSNYPIDDDDVDEEDEVSRIINWATDAARLDPSPSSDIDDVSYDEDDDDDDDDDVSSDDDEGGVQQKADGKKKGLKI